MPDHSPHNMNNITAGAFPGQPWKKNSFYLPVTLAFIMLSLALLPFFRYHLNPDGIAYLRIARYYAEGNLRAAVNGCWSPLLCWMLAPLIRAGLQEMIAFRLLNILLAASLLYQVGGLVRRYCADLPAVYRFSMLVSCALELLILHFNTITPDLLTLVLLLWLLELDLSGRLYRSAWLCGLAGGLLYLSKAYCFYFFLAFLIWKTALMFYTRRKQKGQLLGLAKTALLFLLMAGLWSAAMHWKYQQWMLSSAGPYIISILDAQGVIRHPFESEHILRALPYPEAYFSWEDMPWIYSHSGPHPVYHKDWMVYLKLIYLNAKKLGYMTVGKYPFLLLFILPVGMFLVTDRARRALFFNWPPLGSMAGFVALYISGYLLLSVEPRYVWILLILSTLLVFRLLFFVLARAAPRVRGILAAVAVVPFLYTTGNYIITRINVNKDAYETAMKISAHIPAGSHMAGYYSEDLWSPLFLSDLHDYGGIASYQHPEELIRDLDKFQVNYLVLFTDGQYDGLPLSIKEGFEVGYRDRGLIILRRIHS